MAKHLKLTARGVLEVRVDEADHQVAAGLEEREREATFGSIGSSAFAGLRRSLYHRAA